MIQQSKLSVADFFAFGNAAAAHTADLRIKLAEAGIFDRDDGDDHPPVIDREPA